MTAPPPSTNATIRHPLPPELIHDLRTPLTQIIGYSEMLLEQAQEAGHDGYLPDLRKVTAAGYRLLALIEESFQPLRPTGAPAAAAGMAARGPERGHDAPR